MFHVLMYDYHHPNTLRMGIMDKPAIELEQSPLSLALHIVKHNHVFLYFVKFVHGKHKHHFRPYEH